MISGTVLAVNQFLAAAEFMTQEMFQPEIRVKNIQSWGKIPGGETFFFSTVELTAAAAAAAAAAAVCII